MVKKIAMGIVGIAFIGTLIVALFLDANFFVAVVVEAVILVMLGVKLPRLQIKVRWGWLLTVPLLAVVLYGLFFDLTTASWLLGVGLVIWLVLRTILKRRKSGSASIHTSINGSSGWVNVPLAKQFPRPFHFNLGYLLWAQMQINPGERAIRFRQTSNRLFGRRAEEWTTVRWTWNLDTNQPDLLSLKFFKAILWWIFGLTELELTPTGGGGDKIVTVVGLNTMAVIRRYQAQFQAPAASQSARSGKKRKRR